MFGQKPTVSTGFGSNNNASTGGGLFGNNNNASTTTTGSLFGNNNNTGGTAPTGLFGNNNNATNTTAATGSLFGNSNNNAANGAGTSFGFGQNNQTTPAPTTSTPSFSFGANNNNTATNTPPSLFGSNPQSKPLFGGSGTGTTSSLFGGSTQTQQQPQSQYNFGNNNQTGSSLFSGITQNQGQNQIQQGQSLFKKSSLFSVSSLDADAAKFKESLNNQPQQFNQNQNQNQTSLFSNNNGLINNPSSSVTLGPQASLTLDTGLRKNTTPSWAAEKRYVNRNNNTNRHASSFNTADRGHIAVRKTSLSSLQSPVSSFGTSFSGVSKPSHTKKKAIIQEDPPPTRSIYDVDVSTTLSGPHKSEISVSSLASRSTTPSTGAQASNAGRPKTADHSLSVVIFGFPSSVTPAVVAHFSKFGNIAENVDSSNRIPIISTPTNKSFRAPPTPIQTGKNWLKITYDNPASASRAIQENGTIIAGQFVVGCIPVTAQNFKEFEIASENSIQSGAPSTTDQIEDSIVERNISSFTEVSSSEHTTEESKTSQANTRSLIGKNSSLPSLVGSKKVELKDGRSIFNKVHKQSGYTGSFFKTPDAKKSVSAVKNNNAPNGEGEGDKRLQPVGGQGWVSWTSKKAQELVFGWDDL